ncbi:MAG TPA: inorganic phosphate transporter [Longimicrobiales bacterium]|nr:inorganic phosphate transporter [Longimicrobiales bacterium]
MTLAAGLLLVTIVAGGYMAWNIGANDVANAMGTSVGSGALTLGRAVVLAGIFEFLGAVLVGSHVTDTIRGKILEVSLFAPTGPLGGDGPLVLALGMLSALIAAALWLHLASYLSLPVSTTHSIVGALVGVGIVAVGFAGIAWGTVAQVVVSWVVSPFLGGLLAYLTFAVIRRRVLRDADPIGATRQIAPYLIVVVVSLIVLSFIYKVLKNVMDTPPFLLALAAAIGLGVLCGLITAVGVRGRPVPEGVRPYVYVERIFAGLQIVTACYVAFAHGANDVANAIGPLAAVVNLTAVGFTDLVTRVAVPMWVLVLGGVGIVTGLATYGYRVIATIGKQITEMTPTRGFAAEFGAATTVLIASRLGLPVSTTHTLVGAVIGVGFAQGIAALNLRVIRNIVGSWLATLPAAGAVGAVIFLALRFALV